MKYPEMVMSGYANMPGQVLVITSRRPEDRLCSSAQQVADGRIAEGCVDSSVLDLW